MLGKELFLKFLNGLRQSGLDVVLELARGADGLRNIAIGAVNILEQLLLERADQLYRNIETTAKMMMTCFSTGIGLFCGCLSTSTIRSP